MKPLAFANFLATFWINQLCSIRWQRAHFEFSMADGLTYLIEVIYLSGSLDRLWRNVQHVMLWQISTDWNRKFGVNMLYSAKTWHFSRRKKTISRHSALLRQTFVLVTSKKGIKGSQFGTSIIMNWIKKATCSKLGKIQRRQGFQKAQIEKYNLENQTLLLAFKVHKWEFIFL